MKIIISASLFFWGLLFTVSEAKAQYACYIFYSYDNSGNRVNRYYQCGNMGGGPLYKQVPGDQAKQPGKDSNLVNTCYLRPNPSNGHFSAILEHAVKDAEIYVTNIRGAVLTRTQLNGTKADIDISRYPPGVYVLHLKSGNYEFNTKVEKE